MDGEVEDILKSLAIRDELTGLFGKCSQEQLFIERELRRGEGRVLSLILLNIDRFKMLNDWFGHQVGDIILQEFAKRLQANIRPSDIAFRTGGDEFMVILPETSLEDAKQLAEKVREKAKYLQVENQVINLSLSFGVLSCFSESGLTARESIETVDRAMYLAKQEGRDRISSFKMVDRARYLVKVEGCDRISNFIFYKGVLLPEKYAKVQPTEWSAEWIVEETNVEIKRLLIQEIGYARICQELQANELDSWQEYTLLKIDKNLDVEPICLLKMTCPSTENIHFLRVPPDVNSAREGICWVNWGIAPEEFAVQT